MRKRNENLRQSLLDCAREIVRREGAGAVNIRRIAGETGISVGSVYNYYSGKDDILLALTEEYWRSTLLDMRDAVWGNSFTRQLAQIYTFLRAHVSHKAALLMESLKSVEPAGRERMEAMLSVLRDDILERMERDAGIRATVWNEQFTKERYADFVVRNLTALLRPGAPGPGFFLEIVRRTLY